MMIRKLVWLFPLVLAGCNSVDDPFLQTSALTRDGSGSPPALASSVAPELALGTIPVAGSPATAVRQSVRRNYAQQTIVYGNATDLPGENALTVTVGTPGSDKGFSRAPSQSEIRSEIAASLSGVSMKISQVIGDNAYGAFGYAAGTAGGNAGCIYAWQLARNVSSRDGAGFAAIGGSRYAARVRLRYCAPSASIEQLVGLMNGLRLKPVTARTLDTLRYAAGPAVSAVSVLQPVVQEAAIATQPALQRKRVRRIASPSVVEAAQEPVNADESTIKNPVKVPLPGAAAIEAGTEAATKAGSEPVTEAAATPSASVDDAAETVPVQTEIAKPSLIPLPSAVAARK